MAHINTARFNFAAVLPENYPDYGSFIVAFDEVDGLLKKMDFEGTLTILEAQPMKVKRTLITPPMFATLDTIPVITLPTPSVGYVHVLKGITHVTTYGSTTPANKEMTYNHPIYEDLNLATYGSFGYLNDQATFGQNNTQSVMYSQIQQLPILPGTKLVTHLFRNGTNNRALDQGVGILLAADVHIMTESLRLSARNYGGPIITDAQMEVFVAYERIKYEQ